MIEWPGFRRRLAARIAGWTRSGQPTAAKPPGNDPATRAQWAIFKRYHAILRQLKGEDAEGLAVWASKVLLRDPPASFPQLSQIILLGVQLGLPCPLASRGVRPVEVSLRHIDTRL